MGRIIGYQYDDNVQDGDAWIGSEDGGGRTKQYTAEAVANYLNIQGKISIVGQMTYKYGITPLSGPGTFAVFGGGTDPVAFSAITKLTLSNTDVSKQRVVEFLNLLVGSDILISKQSAISTFGYYSIDSYAVNATDPAYYDLGVTFKSGNGSMEAEQIYETQNFTLAAEENISTLQTTIDAGNTYASSSSLWQWDPGKISQVDPDEEWGLVLSPEEGVIFTDGVGNSAGRSYLQATNLSIGNLTYTGSVFANNLTANRNFQLPNNSGTLALTTDITSSPWDTVTGGINYANGNVGIGTTTPSAKFQVVGGSAIIGDDDFNAVKISANGSATTYNAVGNGFIAPNVNFNINNQTKLTIKGNTGNVGIGTTNPLSPLHVASIASGPIARFINTSGTGGNGVTIQGGNGSGIILSLSDYSNIERLRVNGNGNVGIGTTSPSKLLDVVGANSEIVINDTNSSPKLRLRENGTTAAFIQTYLGNLDIVSSGDINLYSNNTQRVIIKETTGNVGIGTTSPSSELEINGNVGYTSGNAIFPRTKGIAADWYTSKFDGGLNIDNSVGSSGNTAFRIGYWGSGTFAPNIKLSGGGGNTSYFASGNVGIGTTSPNAKLEVNGGSLKVSDTYATVKIIGTGGLSRVFLGDTADEDVGYLEYNHISNYFRIGVNASERMRIDTAGNVGIGTTSPVTKLHAVGEIVGGTTGFSSGMIGFTGLGSYNSSTAVENIDALYLRKGGTDGSSTSIALASASGNQYFVGSRIKFIRTGSNSKGHLAFETKGDTSTNTTSERMRITDGGNVGIGTTSPSNVLTIGTDSTAKGIDFYAGSTRLGSIERMTIGSAVSIGLEGANGRPVSINNNHSSQVIIANGGGNVGIGTTSPTSKLEVAGGDIELSDVAGGITMISPDGTRYRITVANGGTLTVTAV